MVRGPGGGDFLASDLAGRPSIHEEGLPLPLHSSGSRALRPLCLSWLQRQEAGTEQGWSWHFLTWVPGADCAQTPDSSPRPGLASSRAGARRLISPRVRNCDSAKSFVLKLLKIQDAPGLGAPIPIGIVRTEFSPPPPEAARLPWLRGTGVGELPVRSVGW